MIARTASAKPALRRRGAPQSLPATGKSMVGWGLGVSAGVGDLSVSVAVGDPGVGGGSVGATCVGDAGDGVKVAVGSGVSVAVGGGVAVWVRVGTV